jgi:hypothetical protein
LWHDVRNPSGKACDLPIVQACYLIGHGGAVDLVYGQHAKLVGAHAKYSAWS